GMIDQGVGAESPAAPDEAVTAPAPEETPAAGRRPLSVPLAAALVLLVFGVVLVGMGAVAAIASGHAGLHDRLHDWGLSQSLWGRAARRMADASHRTGSGLQLALDFGFSAVNLGLAAFICWLRPRNRTAPLLAFGLIGTGVVFNLQAHLVYEILEPDTFEEITHDGMHVVAALSYACALVVFPDGKLMGRRRRLPFTVSYLALAVVAGFLAQRVEGGAARTASLVTVFGILTPLLGVLAQGYRSYRSPDPVQRQQSRLLSWALCPALVVGVIALVSAVDSRQAELEGRGLVVLPVTVFRVFQPVFLLIPLALLVGIFRFRLWNVDKLISRALVFGALAGLVSAGYAGLVAVLGSLVGQRQEINFLPVVATFAVALLFSPAKDRLQRLANRLVYGRRATPYEVLSRFSERVGESVPTEELLGRMARLLAEGTGATQAVVWMKVGDQLQPAASWGSGDGPAPLPRHTVGNDVGAIPGVRRVVPVHHQGETLGALSVSKPELLTPTEESLLDDLARQAGLVLRNLRLTADLMARLEELRSSRQRLVVAQDEARRRLERNLHDGAQQQLVALRVQLSLAERLAADMGDAAQPLVEMLGELKDQTGQALEELRDLARGIFPPLLAAEGLVTALKAQAEKAPVPVDVVAPDLGRYPREVESAVYFCCLEALQNTAKYAGASHVEVRLEHTDGTLRFSVTDDGRGFDPDAVTVGTGTQNMSDRLEALGGRFRIDSAVGAGTRVEGSIPLGAATTPVTAG
ncbi:MAG TPA: sensor histidine kinase, partial [Acidimicrobiales bacterium]|nr:sensor histidine kinase [Acidimicrobiales bacterium]